MGPSPRMRGPGAPPRPRPCGRDCLPGCGAASSTGEPLEGDGAAASRPPTRSPFRLAEATMLPPGGSGCSVLDPDAPGSRRTQPTRATPAAHLPGSLQRSLDSSSRALQSRPTAALADAYAGARAGNADAIGTPAARILRCRTTGLAVTLGGLLHGLGGEAIRRPGGPGPRQKRGAQLLTAGDRDGLVPIEPGAVVDRGRAGCAGASPPAPGIALALLLLEARDIGSVDAMDGRGATAVQDPAHGRALRIVRAR